MDPIERRIHDADGERGPRAVRTFLARRKADGYAGAKPIGYQDRVGWKIQQSSPYGTFEDGIWLTSRGKYSSVTATCPKPGNGNGYGLIENGPTLEDSPENP